MATRIDDPGDDPGDAESSGAAAARLQREARHRKRCPLECTLAVGDGADCPYDGEPPYRYGAPWCWHDRIEAEGRLCPCGSGNPKEPEHDGRGIFLCYVCESCRDEKLRGYRPEVLRPYSDDDVNEPVDGEYDPADWSEP